MGAPTGTYASALPSGEIAPLPCSDLDKLRIAVAFIVLVKKPQRLSRSAFILDLQRVFPATESSVDAVATADAWRSRALELEERLHGVQTLSDCERTELIALRLSSSYDAPETSAKPSKKTKTHISATSAPETPPLPTAAWTPTLRSMLALLRDDIPRPPINLVLNTFRRTMEGIHGLLVPLLAPSSPSSSDALQCSDTQSLLSITLPQLLFSTLNFVVQAHRPEGTLRAEQDCSSYPSPTSIHQYPPVHSLSDAIDALLHPIQQHIIGPILRAMPTLARERVERLSAPRKAVSSLSAVSLYPATLLPALNAIIYTLDGVHGAGKQGIVRTHVLQERVHALKDCAAFHATQELLQLLGRPREQSNIGLRSPEVRTARLARKEALHTICTALTLFLVPAPRQGSKHSLLRERLSAALSTLALEHLSLDTGAETARSSMALSEVEQDALLSVLERAWAFGIRWDGEEVSDCEDAIGQADIGH